MNTIPSIATKTNSGDSMSFWTVMLFITVSLWWVAIDPLYSSLAVDQKHYWSAGYELISILGGIFGIVAARRWGFKSLLGRAILTFSIGLFLQSFGQAVYNYYTLFAKIEAPYPSIGDIGFFGSIIAYIYGAILLTHISGIKFSLKSFQTKIVTIGLPLIMLVLSYVIFLRGYQNTGSVITTFLDFGYPLGQAIYVSIALLVVYVSRNYLGGVMKKPIILLLSALIVQYVCDFNFLYRANHGIWFAGSFGDYMYAVSYFLMTMALINIGIIRLKMER